MNYILSDTNNYDGGQVTQEFIDQYKGFSFDIDYPHVNQGIVYIDFNRMCSVIAGVSLAFHRFKKGPDFRKFFEEL